MNSFVVVHGFFLGFQGFAQLSSYGANSDNSPITSSTVKLSRSLSDVQEEESDGDDVLNVLLKGSKLTNFSQCESFS